MPTPDPTPATEQDAMKTTEVSPILVTVVGSGKEVGVSGAVGVTGEGQANLITQVITPVMALAVRFGHRFIDALIGAEALKTLDTMADWNLIQGGAFKAALMIALATAVWGLIRDLGTVFTKLEGRFPLSTGNV